MINFMALSDVCTNIVDCPHESPKWLREGIPVIRNFNLVDGQIDLSDDYYVDEETYNKRIRRTIPSEGDIIFSREAPIGNCAIIPSGFKCCLGQRLVLLRVNKEICSPEYLLTVLLSDYVKKQIEQVSRRGSIVSNFNISELGSLSIPIIDNQEKISDFATTISKKIAINKIISKELELMAKTVYDYWFLQYDFPDENGMPYKSSGGKMVWNEELKKEIPEGWHVDFLGNLFASNRGISYNSKTIEGNGVPMINLASFNVDGSYKESGEKTYSGQYTTDKVVRPFDLLMCNTQQTAIDYKKDIIGKAFLVPNIFSGDIVTSHHVTTIQVKNNNMKYFLHRFFNTEYFHKYIAGFTNGTNILGLIFSGIEKYRLEIPDDIVLDKFAALMLDIEMKKSEIIKENQALSSLRDFLLPLLLNGQVRFK